MFGKDQQIIRIAVSWTPTFITIDEKKRPCHKPRLVTCEAGNRMGCLLRPAHTAYRMCQLGYGILADPFEQMIHRGAHCRKALCSLERFGVDKHPLVNLNKYALDPVR